MAFLTGDQSPLAEAGQALYLTGTLTIASTNAATSLSLSLGSLLPAGGSSTQAQPAIFDAKSATVIIGNNGSGQSISGASLQFSDTLNASQTGSVAYTLSFSSIANNTVGNAVAQLTSGILKNLALQLTFGSAPTAGSVSVIVILHQTGVTATVPSDGTKATYTAAIDQFTPAATATDIFNILGSSSKTIRITRLEVSLIATTAGELDLFLIKRTGGTQSAGTAMTAVPNDSANAAATATVQNYTSNPASVGTAVGNVRAVSAVWPVATTATSSMPSYVVWDFGVRPSQAIVLRGATQGLSLNLNGGTIPTGGKVSLAVEFTEE